MLDSARGNIISTLNSSNATQEFLRDIAARSKSEGQAENEASSSQEMSKDRIRDISKDVRKEEDFYLGVFESKESEKVSSILCFLQVSRFEFSSSRDLSSFLRDNIQIDIFTNVFSLFLLRLFLFSPFYYRESCLVIQLGEVSR